MTLECENKEQDFLCRLKYAELTEELNGHCSRIAPLFERIDNEIDTLLALEKPPLGKLFTE